MKLLMENWNKFITEVQAGDKADGEVARRDKAKNKKAKREMGLGEGAKKQLEIKLPDGAMELVDVAYESENWFVWKMGKTGRAKRNLYSINHKASGEALPTSYYSSGIETAKALINDVLENLNISDIASPKLSVESIKTIHNATIESEHRDPAYTYYRMDEGVNSNKLIMENWRKYVNEVIGKEGSDALSDLADAATGTSDEMTTALDKQQAAYDAQKDAMDAGMKSSDKFKEFADAMGTFSDSVGENAEESDKMLELYQKFEEAGLGDFLEKIKDLEPLGDMMKNIDDGKSVGELITGLGEIDMKPEEIAEKLGMVQELRDEFDEYKKEQEEKQAEMEKAGKNASRAGAEAQPDQAPS